MGNLIFFKRSKKDVFTQTGLGHIHPLNFPLPAGSQIALGEQERAPLFGHQIDDVVVFAAEKAFRGLEHEHGAAFVMTFDFLAGGDVEVFPSAVFVFHFLKLQ